ncbi:5'-methylthioadenosine/S-adenosylhomocysteine nucleosidase [Halomicronema hongdechloris C2206]|uniref:5'-methylthioadenosine/S-adenosylhomocysteine nucleosidase n=1 Tax=Halomicronema hongdechloris C2206 TaxID=1641165 RepID=A0A1Z3HHX6_9CYAN|nr:hypothetical protein [Halomicronema hongdechloris]ASC69922.1 5'-methylthioadenosine/S-adenosylhomocysteine nucleosidase [Halomicronema hongdechloris C2206]
MTSYPKRKFPILAERPNDTGTYPGVEIGVIASGDNVIADPDVRDRIAAYSRRIRAIEMEGYGVSKAAWDQRIRCLIVRALCDYADDTKDGTKDKPWQLYAAAAAAGFIKHLLMFDVSEEEAGNS